MAIEEESTHMRVDILAEALDLFNQSTFQLKDAYDKLEQQAHHLSCELEEKNEQLNAKVKEVEQTQHYLNNILESISDGVLAVDLRGIITTANKAALTIAGYDAHVLMGERVDRVLVESKLFAGNVSNQLAINFSKSGIETVIERRDGRQLPIVLFPSAIFDEERNVVGAVFTFKDLTTIRKLEDEIARSQRLASIGEMAAGVAHEIRNPLGGIEMFASMLRRDFSEDEVRLKTIDNILMGVHSINAIVTDMLNFTRSFAKTNFQELRISDVIDEALLFAEAELSPRGITVEKDDQCADGGIIQGDREQLRQVFLNLFINAAHAMPEEDGRLGIGISADGMQVCVTVDDNGKGIVKENISKIFDPFFTTKSTGNGLGLAISHRIVEAHNGSISVTSRISQGTTFVLYFPLI